MDEEISSYKIIGALAQKIVEMEAEIFKLTEANCSAMSTFLSMKDDKAWRTYTECVMERDWLKYPDSEWMLQLVPAHIRKDVEKHNL